MIDMMKNGSEIISGINNIKVFTYKELKNATDDFSESQQIGEGGFGPVYKVSAAIFTNMMT